MSHAKVEENIAYDDKRKTYYITMYYGKNESGKSNKETKSFKKILEARKVLKEFEASKTHGELLIPKKITV